MINTFTYRFNSLKRSTYDSDGGIVTDTTLIWLNEAWANGNRSEYVTDADQDIIERIIYGWNGFEWIPSLQQNWYYSVITVLSVHDLDKQVINCLFANPYGMGDQINCEIPETINQVTLKVYDMTLSLIHI